MRIIKEVRVVESSSSEGFHDTLMWCVKHFQEKNLEVKINNPHTIVSTNNEMLYIAVVEGHEYTECDDPGFPSFNTKSKSS